MPIQRSPIRRTFTVSSTPHPSVKAFPPPYKMTTVRINVGPFEPRLTGVVQYVSPLRGKHIHDTSQLHFRFMLDMKAILPTQTLSHTWASHIPNLHLMIFGIALLYR